MSVDPLAEKHPGLSPYNYVANNPLVFVDPSGSDIVIYFNCNDDGRNCESSWTFTGDNAGDAPENDYVQSFLDAYNYLVSEGEGRLIQELAMNRDLSAKLMQRMKDGQRTFVSNQAYGTIYWDPNAGTLMSNGEVHSPALTLEHESSHAYDYVTQNLHGTRQEREARALLYENRAAADLGEPIRPTYLPAATVYTKGPNSNVIVPAGTQAMYQVFTNVLGLDVRDKAEFIRQMTGISIRY